MDPFTIGLLALSVGSKLYSGYSKEQSMLSESGFLRDEGRIIYGEALRDASIIRLEGERFAQKQANQYIASGVQLGGSALITMAETRKMAGAEATAVERRGKATYDLAEKRAKIMQKEGKASLIAGLIDGATSALSFMGD